MLAAFPLDLYNFEILQHPDWYRREPASSASNIQLVIGLKQSNLDRVDEWVLDVSDPDSPNFGKHWSAQKVAQTFSASSRSVDAVRQWLSAYSIDWRRVWQSRPPSWLRVNMTVAEAEKLLHTRLYTYANNYTGAIDISAAVFRIPQDMKSRIDFIASAKYFDVELAAHPSKKLAQARNQFAAKSTNPSEGKPRPCGQWLTPGCIRGLYGIPTPNTNATSTQPYGLGVVELMPQAFWQQDLEAFFSRYAPHVRDRRPKVVSVFGGYNQLQHHDADYNGESNMDLQVAMALADMPTVMYAQATVWSFSAFLDSLDADHCRFFFPWTDWWNDLPQNEREWNLVDRLRCGGIRPTSVITTSYG